MTSEAPAVRTGRPDPIGPHDRADFLTLLTALEVQHDDVVAAAMDQLQRLSNRNLGRHEARRLIEEGHLGIVTQIEYALRRYGHEQRVRVDVVSNGGDGLCEVALRDRKGQRAYAFVPPEDLEGDLLRVFIVGRADQDPVTVLLPGQTPGVRVRVAGADLLPQKGGESN